MEEKDKIMMEIHEKAKEIESLGYDWRREIEHIRNEYEMNVCKDIHILINNAISLVETISKWSSVRDTEQVAKVITTHGYIQEKVDAQRIALEYIKRDLDIYVERKY